MCGLHNPNILPNERNKIMKNFWNYVENHAWAQWAVAVAFWLVFWAIAEISFWLAFWAIVKIGFALIHG